MFMLFLQTLLWLLLAAIIGALIGWFIRPFFCRDCDAEMSAAGNANLRASGSADIKGNVGASGSTAQAKTASTSTSTGSSTGKAAAGAAAAVAAAGVAAAASSASKKGDSDAARKAEEIRKAEIEKARLAEEKRKAEDAAKAAAAKQKAAADAEAAKAAAAKRKADEAAKAAQARKDAEAKAAKAADEKRKIEEAARAAGAKRKAEADAAAKAAEDKRKAEATAAAKRKADADAAAAADAKRKADAAAAAKAAEDKRKADAAAEAKRKADADAAAKAAEDKRKADAAADAKRKSDAEAAEAKRKADAAAADAKRKAEADAAARAAEAKRQADAAARDAAKRQADAKLEAERLKAREAASSKAATGAAAAAGVAAAAGAATASGSAASDYSAGITDAMRPTRLSAPQGGKADDLKRIKGVGPVIEKTLNGEGVYHFQQVADFNDDNVKWVNNHISFPGRIEREDWIGQAKALAKGETYEGYAYDPDSVTISEDMRPTRLMGAEGGKADDLKKIKGIGPVIEKTLNDEGVYHYRQIAGFTPRNTMWVDNKVSFPGRIHREDWIGQAKALEAGKEYRGYGTLVTEDGNDDVGSVTADMRPKREKLAAGKKGDDLKVINGIGPVIEETLNDEGVYYYRQIADFDDNNVKWVNNHMSFPGRIEREDWIGQAKRLVGEQGDGAVSDTMKPTLLSKPMGGGADDLKRIKGIGKVLEKTLHDLGVYHYRQIAEFTPDNVKWVNHHLAFPGRIERENWIEQASNLAAGKATEYSDRFDDGGTPYKS